MSSVAKSMVEPLTREREIASTRMLEGFSVGWVKWLSDGEGVIVRRDITVGRMDWGTY